MKKITIAFIGFAMVVCLAFTNEGNHSTKMAKRKKIGEWGGWRTTTCYRGLDYRVRRTQEDSFNGPKYEWEVQFKNRYEDVINFNFKIVNPGSDEQPTGRESLNANGISNGEDWDLTTNGERCQVQIAKVRFGSDDDSSKPYVECGQ